jgi:pyruvate formate lyase activating enzyme
MVYWSERCIHCEACLEICLQSAIAVDEAGHQVLLPERCNLCGRCLEECYTGALEQIGRLMTVAEVLAVVAEDQSFYEESGGGVTLSGGEPTTQAGFCHSLLRGCYEKGFHTAIETCGHTPGEVWQTILPYLDLILFDLKEVDPARHKQYTGVSNRLILDNFKRLAQSGQQMIVRRPVIPGYNDDLESIYALAKFLQPFETIQEVNLLPYHRLGQGKYEQLGLEYTMGDQPSLTEEDLHGLRAILLAYGLRVKLGG